MWLIKRRFKDQLTSHIVARHEKFHDAMEHFIQLTKGDKWLIPGVQIKAATQGDNANHHLIHESEVA